MYDPSIIITGALVTGSELLEPATYKEGIKDVYYVNNKEWRKAMDREIDLMKNNEVWQLYKITCRKKSSLK